VGVCQNDERDEDDRARERDRDRLCTFVLKPHSSEEPRAARLPQLYFKIGAPVAFASHFC
jgi:hypothetical protein